MCGVEQSPHSALLRFAEPQYPRQDLEIFPLFISSAGPHPSWGFLPSLTFAGNPSVSACTEWLPPASDSASMAQMTLSLFMTSLLSLANGTDVDPVCKENNGGMWQKSEKKEESAQEVFSQGSTIALTNPQKWC